MNKQSWLRSLEHRKTQSQNGWGKCYEQKMTTNEKQGSQHYEVTAQNVGGEKQETKKGIAGPAKNCDSSKQ